MLKKDPPPCRPDHTKFKQVAHLKEVLQYLPTKSSSLWKGFADEEGASDEYWIAVLLEEIDGKRQICGYTSGKFKQREMHYHSTLKKNPSNQIWHHKVRVPPNWASFYGRSGYVLIPGDAKV